MNFCLYFPCLLTYWVQFSVRDDKMLLSVREFLENWYSKGQAILFYRHQWNNIYAHTMKPYPILQVKKVMQSLYIIWWDTPFATWSHLTCHNFYYLIVITSALDTMSLCEVTVKKNFLRSVMDSLNWTSVWYCICWPKSIVNCFSVHSHAAICQTTSWF